jgi:hypothetical protein
VEHEETFNAQRPTSNANEKSAVFDSKLWRRFGVRGHARTFESGDMSPHSKICS